MLFEIMLEFHQAKFRDKVTKKIYLDKENLYFFIFYLYFLAYL